MPQRLAVRLDTFDALEAAQRKYVTASSELQRAHDAGTLSPETARRVLAKVARGAGEAQAARDAINAYAVTAAAAFVADLKAEGGTELIGNLRPIFDAAVDGLTQAGSVAEQQRRACARNREGADIDAWRALPGHVALLDQVFNTVVLPLVRVFGLMDSRAYDTPLMGPVAFVVARGNLYEAGVAIGSAPRSTAVVDAGGHSWTVAANST